MSARKSRAVAGDRVAALANALLILDLALEGYRAVSQDSILGNDYMEALIDFGAQMRDTVKALEEDAR